MLRAPHLVVAWGQPGRLGDHRARFQPHVLAVAAVAGLAEAAAGGQHRVAFTPVRVGAGDHGAGHIDAAHQREAAQDLPFSSTGQRVLVVDRGPVGADQHLAGVEVVDPEPDQAAAVAGVVVFDAEGGERGGGGHRRCLTSRKTPPYPVAPLSILPIRPILYDR